MSDAKKLRTPLTANTGYQFARAVPKYDVAAEWSKSVHDANGDRVASVFGPSLEIACARAATICRAVNSMFDCPAAAPIAAAPAAAETKAGA